MVVLMIENSLTVCLAPVDRYPPVPAGVGPFEVARRDAVLEEPEAVFVLVVDLDALPAFGAKNEDRVEHLGRREGEGDGLLDLAYPHLHARRAGVQLYPVGPVEADHGRILRGMARACSSDVVILIPPCSMTTTEWSKRENALDLPLTCSLESMCMVTSWVDMSLDGSDSSKSSRTNFASRSRKA